LKLNDTDPKRSADDGGKSGAEVIDHPSIRLRYRRNAFAYPLLADPDSFLGSRSEGYVSSDGNALFR
jgi:hypothetical protein